MSELWQDAAAGLALVRLRQVRFSGLPSLLGQASQPEWAGVPLQPMSLWTDEGGKIVFLYIRLRVRKRTIQKFRAIVLKVGSIRWAGGETAGAAVFL
jgi:hypothetical protein